MVQMMNEHRRHGCGLSAQITVEENIFMFLEKKQIWKFNLKLHEMSFSSNEKNMNENSLIFF